MPDLHFLSGHMSITTPTPILSVAILYVAATHYPSITTADYQDVYLEAFARCLGLAMLPVNPFETWHRHSSKSPGQCRFDDVLAIILVGLLAVGTVEAVGSWISLGYRMLLSGIHETGPGHEEWRCLWEGLRVSDYTWSKLMCRQSSWSTHLLPYPLHHYRICLQRSVILPEMIIRLLRQLQ